jgi:peptidyl-prolyl cis-trans isomerase D
MMQLIRSGAGKIIVPVIVLAFVGWMVFEAVVDGGASGSGELGSVNGSPITVEAYNQRFNALYAQAQSSGTVSAEASRRLQDQAWDQLVNELLVRQEIRRRGIGVTDREIVWAARNLPHPQLMQEEIFQTDGMFDIEKYRAFLAGPTIDGEMFAQLESYYRDWLPQERLARQLSAGRYTTDAELWRQFRHTRESVTVDFVAMDLGRIPEPQIADADVRRYYEQNRDRFRRGERARMKVAFIPLTITEADRAATLERARELRAEITGGADFAVVARRESADPGSAAAGGDLGTFGRGQMVPEFEEAVFSLPIGAVSEPVITAFGAHLIQVQARENDEATARHILLEFEKGDEQLAQMEARLDSIRSRARTAGLQAAVAGIPGVTYRDGVEIGAESTFVPGVGSLMEALSWAADEAAAGDGERISDVLETGEALYVVEIDEYRPAGIPPLAELTPSIRMLLAERARVAAARSLADSMAAQVRAGRTLEEVAAERGLAVERSEPFTRLEPNPRFGQANEAIGVAFGTPVGQVGAPAVARRGNAVAGVFLIRPVERIEADRREWERQKTEQRAQTAVAGQQERFQLWLIGAREEARIRDNRARMTSRS